MKNSREVIFLCLFRKDDKRRVEDRIRTAAADCSRQYGWFLNAESQEQDLFSVGKTELGKPYFKNCPQLYLSISHSGDYWVCALADEEIGVDLQEHVRNKGETIEGASIRFRKMAHRFFHPLEAEFVEQKDYENFFDTWSAREAYVKYTGQGIDREFSQHCVVPDSKEEWMHLSGNPETVSWQAQNVWFSKLRYRDAYSLCACTKNRKKLVLREYSVHGVEVTI